MELRSLNVWSTSKNFTSPFYTEAIVHGVYDANHTSTVGIAFDRSTLPTPWPIIVASIGLSLITASWALYTIRKGSNRSWVAGLCFSLLNTVRSVAALVSASRALAGHGGLWPAPSATCALVLSNIPYTYRSPAPFDSVAIIDTLLSFTALGITGLAPWYRWEGLSYGKMSIFGGNCPAFVALCPDQSHLNYAGCGWIDPKDPDYQFDGSTIVSLVEKIIGMAFFAPLAFGSWIVVFLVIGLLAKAFSGITEWLSDPDWEPANCDKHRRRQKVFLILKVVFISIAGLATISAHLNQERPKPIYPSLLLDSFGPVRNLSTESAGESWTDCFVVDLPWGRLGFMDIWWSTAKSRPEHILGLL